MEMGCMVMPRCPYLKPHFQSRVARVALRSTVFLRTAARMESSAAANATADSASTAQVTEADTVVQYVVLRRDLIDTWPLGSVVTQGCHASVAAIWTHKDDPDTLSYCSPPNLDSMHKVTLEVKGETQLLNLSEKLKAGGIAHKLWIEQPENFSTCLATKPYPKSTVSSFFKKLKLCKWIASLEEANRRKRSGMSQKDIKMEAHTIYDANDSKFQDLIVYNDVMSKHPKWAASFHNDATRLRPEDEMGDEEESGGSTKRLRSSEDGEYHIPSNLETSTTEGSTIFRPSGRDKSKKKSTGKCKATQSGSKIAAELRALRLTKDNENELIAKKLELESQKLQMNSLKMEKRMLNTLLAKDHLSPEDEEMKRRLIALVFGQN